MKCNYKKTEYSYALAFSKNITFLKKKKEKLINFLKQCLQQQTIPIVQYY